jgi:DNA-binding PucR family transcriptional regulator
MTVAAADARLSSVAATVGAHVVELSDDVWSNIVETIPELRADELVIELLRASVAENVARLLHVFQHGFPIDAVGAPTAAVEYARRLAQRGIAVIPLVRAYRIGHARYLRWCLNELARQEVDRSIVMDTTHLMLDVSFAYVDRITEQVVTAYQNERDRWLLSQTAVRASRVSALLSQRDADIDAAESALGYRLRQHHLALLLWVGETTTNGAGLIRLDRLAAALAAELGAGRPLFVPRDETLAWAWLPLGAGSHVAIDPMAEVVERNDHTARVAVGAPAGGLDGFRQSHQRAVGAQTVALAARPGRRVTTFAEVGPLALMCHDMVGTRGWVRGVLGDLAIDDEAHERLRDTVREFLTTGGSYAATGEHLTVHKNTVHYRLRKAEELLGRPLSGDEADLDLAIRACQHLGSAVLKPLPARA